MTAALRPVFFVVGMMIAALSAAMFIPAAIDTAYGHTESARAFFMSALIGLAVGGAFTLANRSKIQQVSPRTAFVLTGGAWLALALIAAIPIRMSGQGLDWTDSFFEWVSGLTTTGSTILTGLDTRPPGFLIWRAILQWIGGIGIIVTAMAFWPMLGVGGMQLFRLESSDTSEKMLPRATEVATAISLIYLVLTAACFVAYQVTGMNWIDALAHAMTTIATGGYSTSDQSLGAFMGQGADLVAIVFMLLAGLPFGMLLLAARGKPQALWKDAQVRGFAFVILAAWRAYNHPGADRRAWRGTRLAHGDIQRSLHHHRHRVCHDGLRRLGPGSRSCLLHLHVHRRLRGFDHLQREDLPLPDRRLGPCQIHG